MAETRWGSVMDKEALSKLGAAVLEAGVIGSLTRERLISKIDSVFNTADVASDEGLESETCGSVEEISAMLGTGSERGGM